MSMVHHDRIYFTNDIVHMSTYDFVVKEGTYKIAYYMYIQCQGGTYCTYHILCFT
jgi:hypothetical protein